MPAINSAYNNDPNLVPFDFPEIVGAFAPRAFLASAPVRDDNFEVSASVTAWNPPGRCTIYSARGNGCRRSTPNPRTTSPPKRGRRRIGFWSGDCREGVGLRGIRLHEDRGEEIRVESDVLRERSTKKLRFPAADHVVPEIHVDWQRPRQR